MKIACSARIYTIIYDNASYFKLFGKKQWQSFEVLYV